MGAQRRRNYNFRQSHSERSAEGAYSNFKKEMVRKFKVDSFKNSIKVKFGKYKQEK
jgi:hypothetical protein